MTVAAARDFGRRQQWALAQRLYLRRTELGLRQEDLVQRLGQQGLAITPGAISNWERTGSMDLPKLLALCGALECSLSYLVGLTKDPARWEPDEDVDLVSLSRVLAQSSPAASPRPRRKPKRAASGGGSQGRLYLREA